MAEYRAIPPGFMTVGQLAKQMDVTVRTLQYYDREGVLAPSGQSEGGRRLYTYKDVVKLHQILSMKYLGFSLEDIKKRLPSINTPQEVAALLTQQAAGVNEKIKSLKETLKAIEKLQKEVLQIKEVNWEKYAGIITMLQAKSGAYGLVKYMDGQLFEELRDSRGENQHGIAINLFEDLGKKAAAVQKAGLAPESAEGQALAKFWWDNVMVITGGDASLLSRVFKMGEKIDDNEWSKAFPVEKDFIGEALGIYLESIGYEMPDL